MKKYKIRKNYTFITSYVLLFAIFLVFCKVESSSMLSVAILAGALSLGASIFITPLLFIASFFIIGNTGILASAAISAGVLTVAVFIYKCFDSAPKYELPALVAISLIGYIILGNTDLQTDIIYRVIVSAITTVLALPAFLGGRAIKEKGLKIKMRGEEITCIIVCISLFGLGLSNLTAPFIWKFVCLFVILTCAFIFRTGLCTLIATALGISFAIYYNNISFIALYTLFGLLSEGVTPFSRYIAAVALVAAEYLVQIIFSIYGAYTLTEFLFTFIAAALYCLTPTKVIKELKEKLYAFREKQLARQSINRNRLMLSNRLYEIATVFTEMANAFTLFKKNAPSEENATAAMEQELKKQVCSECRNFEKCKRLMFDKNSPFVQLISVGLAKGKISFIDLPKELGDNCIKPSDVLYLLNKMLAGYKNTLISTMNLSNGRDLIAEQACGVSEILRGLALECGSLLKYQSRTERALTDKLVKEGLSVCELLIYGEGEDAVICVITDMKEVPTTKFTLVISSVMGFDVTLGERAAVTQDKLFMSFSKSAEFDAVFGLASAKKDTSSLSGDTHAAIRIPNDKFLVALSDGMGSGKDAEKVSSVSLALIESFYKAGLSSPLILKTVNKLLSVNTEDTFTALDVSVIDLKTLGADFIKYGSPYGFIVGKNGIRIIEGNSLPLGILEELKPSVCHTELDGGDMLVLVTDGISDAFGSSSEVIDYLRSVPAKNPQTLAEGILEKAITLNGGERKDDMTAIAVRVFKKQAS